MSDTDEAVVTYGYNVANNACNEGWHINNVTKIMNYGDFLII